MGTYKDKIDNPLFIFIIASILTIGLFFYMSPFNLTTKDSGEYLVSARYLNIAHPPGAPLYILLLKIFYHFLGLNGAYLLNMLLAIIFVGLFIGVCYHISHSPNGLFNVFLLIPTYLFFKAFLYIETDALIYTMFMGVIYLQLKGKYKTSIFLYLLSFWVNYQLLFLAPAFLLFPIYRRKGVISIGHLGMTIFVVFSMVLYLPFRDSARFSWEKSLKRPYDIIRYMGLMTYKVKKNLDVSRINLLDFIRHKKRAEFLLSFIFIMVFFFLTHNSYIKYYLLSLFLLYLLFFSYTARAGVVNSYHYALPLWAIALLLGAYTRFKKGLFFILAVLVAILPGLRDMRIEKGFYDYNLPLNYARISTMGINRGIFFIARDCHINYFRFYLGDNSGVIPINISDLSRKSVREYYAKSLNIPLPDGDIPEIVNYIIREYKGDIYYENDPIFSFIDAMAQNQGLRKKVGGNFRYILSNLYLNLPNDYPDFDEELYNIILGFRISLYYEILYITKEQPLKGFKLFERYLYNYRMFREKYRNYIKGILNTLQKTDYSYMEYEKIFNLL